MKAREQGTGNGEQGKQKTGLSELYCIIVSHRLALAKLADRVVVLEHGQIIEVDIKIAISKFPQIEVRSEATCGEIGFLLIEQIKPDILLIDLLLPDMSD